MQVLAHAKINLSLEVLGRREDGYHQVATVLHSIGLADRLTFDFADELSLECERYVAPVEANLVMKAARLIKEHTGCTLGAAMCLEKRIPVTSGLGGGSSDAAATLKALNQLWGLNLPVTELRELAACAGSDVPFFLDGGCALAEGRGVMLAPLPALNGWWAVVLSPGVHLEGKTERLYAMLTQNDFTDGSDTMALARSLRARTTTTSEVKRMPNVFDRAAAEAFPGLEECRKAVLDAGAPFVRMTGSGPAFFTLVRSQREGEAIQEKLAKHGWEAYLARLIG